MNLMEWEVGIPGKPKVSCIFFSLLHYASKDLFFFFFFFGIFPIWLTFLNPSDSLGGWSIQTTHDIP